MFLEMLVSALLTALSVPGDAGRTGDEFAAQPDESAAPGDEFTDETHPSATYECVVADESGGVYWGGGGEVRIYCLAYCEGFSDYRRAWDSPVDPVEKPDGWCRSKARKYCHRYNLDYYGSCYGERY